jgi:hypothetical protein
MKDDEKKPEEQKAEETAVESKPKERAPDFVGYGEAPKLIDRDETYVH